MPSINIKLKMKKSESNGKIIAVEQGIKIYLHWIPCMG
jgi:hypothetical protein